VNQISPAVEPVQISAVRDDARTVAELVAAAFDEHDRSIYGLMLSVTRDAEMAADLTQEAFLRLIEELGRGRQPDNVGGWLYRTASNLAISRARRAAVARRLAPRLLRRSDPDTPEQVAVDHERSTALRAALGRLGPADRIVLTMAAQGLTGREIADHLGKRHGAVRTLLSRARVRLRASLASEEGGR
jgi:RNA polymerase sigma-70 factor (ECF subfamily)